MSLRLASESPPQQAVYLIYISLSSRQAGPGSEWKRGNLILSQLASTYRSSTRCPAQRVGFRGREKESS